MLTVNELAIQANTPAHVVRYYTRIGLIEPSAQQENGYRLFSPSDANRLRFIRMAKQLGFTPERNQGDNPARGTRRIALRRRAAHHPGSSRGKPRKDRGNAKTAGAHGTGVDTVEGDAERSTRW